MNKTYGIAALAILLPCLVTAALLLGFPHIAGRSRTVEPHLSSAVTSPETNTPFVDDIVADIPFSLNYSPEEMFWITPTADFDTLIGQAIPSLASSLRYENVRIIADGEATQAAAEAINGLQYTTESVSLGTLDGIAAVTFRYSLNESVTVYETGHIAFSTWSHAAVTENGTACYKLLSDIYSRAEAKFGMLPGTYAYFCHIANLPKPSTSLLQTGGAVYIIGDTYYVCPVTRREIFLQFTSSSSLVHILTKEDVLYLVRLVEYLSNVDGKALLVNTVGGADTVVDLAKFDGGDILDGGNKYLLDGGNKFYNQNVALLSWLSSLSSINALCSVRTVLTSENEIISALVTEAVTEDFWFFPNMTDLKRPTLLPDHYTGVEDRSHLDFPCFHFTKTGIVYYPSLAQNVPVRLTGNGLTIEIPAVDYTEPADGIDE
ncbi:MAG: hypothetical protein IJD10_07550 [Clostridia bacterium]|nr:hypothetical protein [Clostridia bacterium]